MLGATFASLLLLAASAVAGQAVLALAGRRAASPLAAPIGLALLVAVAWGAVRLPGEGTAAATALAIALGAALFYVVRGRVSAGAVAPAELLAVVAIAAALAALPFAVEGRVGILGTGLNPDMSQHLFAADRLAAGGVERLISEGYPLGPHALVVALSALGPSPVEAFAALAIVTAVAACLTALAALERFPAAARVGGALVVGFAYLLASFHVQGAFKESLQALFLLAFAVVLHETARDWPRQSPAPRALRALPLAALAIGAAYTYSFPGLVWLAGAAGAWAAFELARAARRGGGRQAARVARLAAPSVLVATGALGVAIAPELGRMASFASFETFDPAGGGLGNLFDRLNPLEALGIWPSGDFRVEPGDGAIPAPLFWLGGLLAGAALAIGFRRWLGRWGSAVPAALVVAVGLWVLTLVAGTPYQEAKALLLIAPLAALIAVRGLVAAGPRALALSFLLAAGGSGLLALANGPVGPEGYSPALAELRPELGPGSVLVLAPAELLAERHGRDYLVWELRGNRVCVDGLEATEGGSRPGVATEIVIGPGAAVEPAAIVEHPEARGPGPCPLIPDGARADPSAGE